MKKTILILSAVALTFASCKKEDVQPNITTTTAPDCNCDRVVSVNSFNLPDGTMFGDYVTVNDCTNFQQNHSFTGVNNKPSIGDCK